MRDGLKPGDLFLCFERIFLFGIMCVEDERTKLGAQSPLTVRDVKRHRRYPWKNPIG